MNFKKVFIFLILIYSNLYSQGLKVSSIYVGLGYGMPSYHMDKNLDFIKGKFPNCLELNKDFSAFEFDSITAQKRNIEAFNFELGLTFKIKDSSTWFNRNTSFRSCYTNAYHNLANDIKTRSIYTNTALGVADTLSTEMYYFHVGYSVYQLGADMLFYSGYFGKIGSGRVYGGVGFVTGLAKVKLHFKYSYEEFMAVKNSSQNNSYSIMYPKLNGIYRDEYYNYSSLLFNNRIQFPLGLEATGRKKIASFGLELRPGFNILSGKGIETLTSPYFAAMFTFSLRLK